MTAVETRSTGSARRLSLEEEQHAAELFAQGLSTRAVAKELGVGNGTAARLKQRLAERDASAEPEPHDEDTSIVSEPDGPEALSALRAKAEQLTTQHAGLTERAAAAREAVEDVDAQRIEALAGGGDSSRFASRRLELEAEHARLTADAAVVAGLLADIEAEIRCREARGQLAHALGALARNVDSRDSVYSRSGDQQRAYIEASWASAVGFAQIAVDEQAADAAVAQAFSEVAALCQQLGEPVPEVAVPVSTWLPASASAPAGPELALVRAMFQARRGDVGQVAVHLAEAGGWLPPPPPDAGELAQRAEVAAQRSRQLEEERARTMAGPGWQPPPPGANLDDYTGQWEVRRDRSDAYPGTPPERAYLPFYRD